MQGRNDQQDRIETIAGLHRLIPDDYILKRIDKVLKTGWVHDLVRHTYSQEIGRPSIDPEAALRLMLAGFLLGIVHDRKLCSEARVNVAIRWFCGYGLMDPMPDHSTLTRIRERWGLELFREMFQRVVGMCVEAGLVDGETIHVDSTLIRADVDKYGMVEDYVERVFKENAEDVKEEGGLKAGGCSGCVGKDRGVKKKRGKRKRGRSKKAKRSPTDPEAVLAKDRRRGDFIPAYKGHLVVDDRCGVIVDVEVTKGSANESTQLMGQIERTESNTGSKVGKVTADAGYATSANYGDLEEMGVDAVIPPQPERRKGKIIPARRFKYDQKHDHVVCPEGRKLTRSSAVDVGWNYKAKAHDCRKCRLKARCVPVKSSSRSIYIPDGFTALLRGRRRKYRWKEECSESYTRHRWMAEGRVAETKVQHKMSRAVRRGLPNVTIQALVTAMAINLKRLAASLLMPFTALFRRVFEHPGSVWRENFPGSQSAAYSGAVFLKNSHFLNSPVPSAHGQHWTTIALGRMLTGTSAVQPTGRSALLYRLFCARNTPSGLIGH